MMIDLELIPNSPGIYFLYDKNGKILYIGKACNVRQRISRHMKIHLDFSLLLSKLDKIKELSDKEVWILKYKMLNTWSKQPIDVVFNEVNEIKYKLVKKGDLRKVEKEYIENMSPPFNWDTSTKRYFDEQNRLLDAIKMVEKEDYFRIHHSDMDEDRWKLLEKCIK